MKLSPFVFQGRDGKIKNSQGFECFDEASPCVLEQISACVIKDSTASATSAMDAQQKYVPWLICMDTDGENKPDASLCAKQVGLNYADISSCQKTDGLELLKELVKQDAEVHQTPTVKINGSTVRNLSVKTVTAAICKADPTLKGCSGQDLLLV